MLNKPEFPRAGHVRLSAILAPSGPIPVSKQHLVARRETGPLSAAA